MRTHSRSHRLRAGVQVNEGSGLGVAGLDGLGAVHAHLKEVQLLLPCENADPAYQNFQSSRGGTVDFIVKSPNISVLVITSEFNFKKGNPKQNTSVPQGRLFED